MTVLWSKRKIITDFQQKLLFYKISETVCFCKVKSLPPAMQKSLIFGNWTHKSTAMCPFSKIAKIWKSLHPTPYYSTYLHQHQQSNIHMVGYSPPKPRRVLCIIKYITVYTVVTVWSSSSQTATGRDSNPGRVVYSVKDTITTISRAPCQENYLQSPMSG